MPRKLTEQKVLEGLIRAHLNNLEYKISTGVVKTSPSIISESAQITLYINRYRKLGSHPKLGEYIGRSYDILNK